MTRMRDVLLGGAAMLLAGGLLTQLPLPAFAAETAVQLPAPAVDVPATPKLATAVFAGGCFWGVQGVYSHVKGVQSAVSGYAAARRTPPATRPSAPARPAMRNRSRSPTIRGW